MSAHDTRMKNYVEQLTQITNSVVKLPRPVKSTLEIMVTRLVDISLLMMLE